ncbi:MAG: glycine--tRNA ligase subunit beta [Leptospirillia bacterium]
MSKTSDLVLEIGCEEIPHDLLAGGIAALSEALSGALNKNLLSPESVDCYGTPRRLVAIVRSIPAVQPKVEETVTGPPEKAGRDSDGNWTKAAEGFAKKQGVNADDLFIEETAKGPYLALKKTVGGAQATDILAGLLPDVLSGIHWAKAMRWADGQGPFVRPIRWICAVLGGEVVPFTFAGVNSGKNVHGHRFMAPEAIAVTGPDDYLTKIEAARVCIDPEARKARIREQLTGMQSRTGGMLVDDEALITATALKTEWPVAVLGRFDKKYLEVPRQVLTTSMREHQDDFAFEDTSGNLVPAFVNFADNEADDLSLIAAGNERVLRARLEDARFFFTEDQKKPLADFAPMLESFLFQKELGSMADKVTRITALARELAPRLGADPDAAARAAELCKLDLVTGMVYEFADLQGVMGGIYARKSGEPEAVAAAIEEHYLPESAMGELPRTPAGRAVALADKLDSICGIVGVGLTPSGSQDPYALRRAGAGVVRMLAETQSQVDLREVVKYACEQLQGLTKEEPGEVFNAVYTWLGFRLEYALSQQGLRNDVVVAILSTGGAAYRDPHDAAERARALNALTNEPGFDDLMTGCKRIVKIVPGGFTPDPVNPDAFTEPAERELWNAFEKARGTIRDASLPAAERLAALAALRPQIDRYFDDVMVMDEDAAVRQRRLSMVAEIGKSFSGFADFSQVVVAGDTP